MRRTGGPVLTAARRRFAEAMGVDPDRMAFVGAVHGAAVARVEAGGVAEGCDALVTDTAGVPLFASFADCYPIVVFDPVHGAAGLAHAGWRGTAAGVAANTVRAMQTAFGSRPADLLVGIGPGICGDCYEVGPEVARRFPAETVRPARDDRFLLDLVEANRRALLEAGVEPPHVFVHGSCTVEDERLPSHRRDADGGRFGCIVALLPT